MTISFRQTITLFSGFLVVGEQWINCKGRVWVEMLEGVDVDVAKVVEVVSD